MGTHAPNWQQRGTLTATPLIVSLCRGDTGQRLHADKLHFSWKHCEHPSPQREEGT